MKLIDINRTYPYVLQDDRDKGEVPVFHIKPLTYRDSLVLTEQITFNRSGDVRFEDKVQTKEQMFVEKVIKIENVIWPGSSEPVTVETESDKKKLFSFLSMADGLEIILAIQNLSRLEEDEAKN